MIQLCQDPKTTFFSLPGNKELQQQLFNLKSFLNCNIKARLVKVSVHCIFDTTQCIIFGAQQVAWPLILLQFYMHSQAQVLEYELPDINKL